MPSYVFVWDFPYGISYWATTITPKIQHELGNGYNYVPYDPETHMPWEKIN